MNGKHEPPTKRSLYISVATSTLRALIVIALVVGGIVLINRAFPASEGALGGDGGVATTTTPPTTPPGTTSPGAGTGQQATPQLAGLNVAVRNGAGVTGLAADTAALLEKRFDVNAIQIDDAPLTVSVTTIYYRRAANQDEAELLARRFFKDVEAEVAPLEAGSGVLKDVQIAIYLGTDYAAATS